VELEGSKGMIPKSSVVLDLACSEEHGLEFLTDLDLLKEAFRRCSRGKTIEVVVEEMCSLAHPTALLLDLLSRTVRKSPERLTSLCKVLVENKRCFEEELVRTFADAYRRTLVRYRLLHGNYRKAWSEVKAAHKGYAEVEVPPGQPAPHGGAFELAASEPTIHLLINEVHAEMVREGLVTPIKHAYVPYRASTTIFPTAPTVAGWPFACAVGGVDARGVNKVGQMILDISYEVNKMKGQHERSLFDQMLSREGV